MNLSKLDSVISSRRHCAPEEERSDRDERGDAKKNRSAGESEEAAAINRNLIKTLKPRKTSDPKSLRSFEF
jgi:hypothetical protein